MTICEGSFTPGGFSLGLLVQEESSNGEWPQMLLEYIRHYQGLVMTMTAVESRRLAELLVTVIKPLSERLDLEAATL